MSGFVGGTPPPPPGARAVHLNGPRGNGYAPRFRLQRFSSIRFSDEPDYCIKDLLPQSGLAIIWGPPKCGKSFWTFDLLMHVALGWPYRGRRVCQGAIVYVCLEGQRAFAKRIEAFRHAKLMGGEDPPFFLITTPLALRADQQTLIRDISLERAAPTIVCIDTLNRSFTGSESNDEDMTAYIKAADTIRNAFNCLVAVVHHSPHDGSRPRGHSSLMGSLDVQIAVRKDGDNVVAELELAKDMEAGATFVSKLEKIELGCDNDGDPITSLIVRELEDAAPVAKPTKDRRASEITNIKREIASAYDRLAEGTIQTYGLDGALVRKVPIDKIRDEVKSRGYLDANENGKLTNRGRVHFHRAKTDLFASKKWVEAEGQFWRL